MSQNDRIKYGIADDGAEVLREELEKYQANYEAVRLELITSNVRENMLVGALNEAVRKNLIMTACVLQIFKYGFVASFV